MLRVSLILAGVLIAAQAVPAHAQQDLGSFESPSHADGSVAAIFDHTGQITAYRTHLSGFSSLWFAEDLYVDEGILQIEPADGIISWEMSEEEPTLVGPLSTVTAAPVSGQDFNLWIEEGEKSRIVPSLFVRVIPVSAQPVDLNQNQLTKTWTNLEKVTTRIFVRDCVDGSFLRIFGDVLFAPGAIRIVTRTDDTGDLQIEISADAAVLSPDIETWEHIVLLCGFEPLPQTALKGFSVNFSGTSSRETLDPTTLPGLFDALASRIKSLVFSGAITEKEADRLFKYVNKASESAASANTIGQVGKAIENFHMEVETLLQEDRIGSDEAEGLIETAVDFEATTFWLANQPLPQPNVIGYCGSQPGACPVEEACELTTFFVAAEPANGKPDGSEERPFSSVVEALNRAELQGLCGVEVAVAEGAYFGDLVITRRTLIRGSTAELASPTVIRGSVANSGPHRLTMENLIISPIGNGIVVDHPCARTVLDNVRVVQAEGFGIHHRGGSLLAGGLTVLDTVAVSDALHEGTAVLLTCGARAVLGDVDLDNNESSALILSGPGTTVSAFDLHASNTGVHPSLPRPGYAWGAVHVRDDAELMVHGFDIRNNKVFGVRVEANGRARFTGSGGVVRRTRTQVPPGCEPPIPPSFVGWCEDVLTFEDHIVVVGPNSNISHTLPVAVGPEMFGGLNAAAFRGGTLRLTFFESTDALAGILVGENGEVDLDTGIVRHCAVGASVQVPGYDLSRLGSRVVYRDNGIDLDADPLPVPDPGLP
jgi:hypothetical protein